MDASAELWSGCRKTRSSVDARVRESTPFRDPKNVSKLGFFFTSTVMGDVLASRTQVIAATEGVGGLRVGDMAGADDCHGLVAPDVYLLQNVETKQESIELVLDTGKTGFGRTVNIIDKTLGSPGSMRS